MKAVEGEVAGAVEVAARLPFPVDYLVFPTLLSFLVCVIVVGAGVFAANAGPPTAVRLAAAAVFMGGGIATMHYIGMSALQPAPTWSMRRASWWAASRWGSRPPSPGS